MHPTRRLFFVFVTVAVAVVLLILGAHFALRESAASAPGFASSQIYAPSIAIVSGAPRRNLAIEADFRNDESYVVRIRSGTLQDLEAVAQGAHVSAPAGAPIPVLISVQSLTDFSWEGLDGLTPIQLNSTTRTWKSSTIDASSGTSKYIAMRGILEKSHLELAFKLRQPSSQVKRGPYLRIALPDIDTIANDPNGRLLPAEAHGTIASSPTSNVGTADGRPLYAALLGIWVDASPYDQLNDNLIIYKMTPTPPYSPPWHGKSRATFFSTSYIEIQGLRDETRS